jgi:hypothetical protein
VESDLPTNLSQPAQRAFDVANITRLEQFTQMTPTEILKLHGVGPKTIRQLRAALAARGWSFAGEKAEDQHG